MLKKKPKKPKLPESFKRFQYFSTKQMWKIMGEEAFYCFRDFCNQDALCNIRTVKHGNKNYWNANDVFKYLYPEASDLELMQIEAYTRLLLSRHLGQVDTKKKGINNESL